MALRLLGLAIALATCQLACDSERTTREAKAAYERGDYATAAPLMREAAEQGDAFAQFALGFMYDHGRGVAQDDAEAVKW